MAMALVEIDCAGACFQAGEAGALVKISAAQGGTECYQTGSVKRHARETELSHKLAGRKLEVEIVVTHWDRKITVDVPNDTSTHRARNYAGYYKNMPGGVHLKLELPLAKLVGPAAADGTSSTVLLQLQDAAHLKWLHNPHRLYGPWGERERGPFHAAPPGIAPTASPVPPHSIRLTFDTPVNAVAFAQSLAAERAPKPKAAAASNGAENGDPQAPRNPLLPLEGMSFVFTGNDGLDCRTSREHRVRQLGGKVTSAVSGKTSYLIAYDRSTKKFREASQRQRDSKPGPRIVDEAGIDAVLGEAAATRKAAETKLATASTAAASSSSSAAAPTNAGPSRDEPDAKRQCV